MSEYSDYVILIDENGQPYIAHSIFSNARQKGAKYIQKIKDGAKTRYFYTKAELEAYYNKGKQATKEAASKAKSVTREITGKAAKDRLDAAQKDYRYKSLTDKATSYLLNTNLDKRDAAVAKGDNKSAEKYQKEADKWFDKRWHTELNDPETAYKTGQIYTREGTYDKRVDAYSDYRKAITEYEKTPLAKIEKAADVINRGKDIVKEYASDKIAQIKDILGYDEKQRYEDARDYWDRTINLTRPDNLVRRTEDGAIDNEANSKQQRDAAMDLESRKIEYYNTPIGKIPEAREKINTAYDRAYNRVTDKIDEIRSSAKATVEKIERERDFAGAPKAFKKLIEKNSKNLGISKEEAKQRLIDWTTEYYTNANDLERRDKYLEAINSINV